MDRTAGRRWVAPAAVAVAGSAISCYLLQYDTYSLLWPDSGSYIDWEIARSAGYPLFLRAIRLAGFDLGSVRPVQLALLVAAAVVLTFALDRLLRVCDVPFASLLAAGVGCLFVGNIALMRFGLSVLSEALFATCTTANLALFLWLLVEPKRGTFRAFGFSLAATILVRPAGLSLALSIPLLILLHSTVWRRILVDVCLPVASLLLLAATLNFARDGVFVLQEMGGISLAGHVASLSRDTLQTKQAEPVARIVTDLRPWREQASQMSWPREAYEFTTVEYNPMVHVVVGRFGEYVDGERRAGRLLDIPRNASINRLCGEFGRAIVWNDPFGYLRHVAAHVYGMWVIPQWRSGAGVDAVEERVAAQRLQTPVADYGDHLLEFVSRRSNLYLAIARTTMAVVFVASVAGALAPLFLGLRDPIVAGWAFASLNLHAAFLLICAVQAAAWRYSIVWWAHALLSVTLGMVMVVRRSKS